jgi:hypothetical protein
MAMHELDRIKADLEQRFPGWQVWWVRAPGSTVWCARRVPQLQAESPEELELLLQAQET